MKTFKITTKPTDFDIAFSPIAAPAFTAAEDCDPTSFKRVEVQDWATATRTILTVGRCARPGYTKQWYVWYGEKGTFHHGFGLSAIKAVEMALADAWRFAGR
jgi:hypothetical protein